MKMEPKKSALGGIIIALRKSEGQDMAGRKAKCKECGKAPCECEEGADEVADEPANIAGSY